MPSGGKREGSGRKKALESSNAQLQAEKLKLEIRNKELDLAVKEGKLVEKESVLKTLAEVMTVTKQKLQNIPRKLATQCVGQEATQIEDLLTKAIREALQELSVLGEQKTEENEKGK